MKLHIDVEDLERAFGGDQRAFTKVVRECSPVLYRTIRRIRKCSPAQAEDLVQEVWLRVVRSRTTWDPARGRFETWLFRIAQNAVKDDVRSDSRKGASLIGDETVIRLSEEEFSHGRAREESDAVMYRSAIRKALNCLSPNQRAAVVIVDYLSFSVKEAAEILADVPGPPLQLTAVRSRLKIGRRKLRDALERELAERRRVSHGGRAQ